MQKWTKKFQEKKIMLGREWGGGVLLSFFLIGFAGLLFDIIKGKRSKQNKIKFQAGWGGFGEISNYKHTFSQIFRYYSFRRGRGLSLLVFSRIKFSLRTSL